MLFFALESSVFFLSIVTLMKRVSGKQQRKQFNGCNKAKDDHPTAIWNAICCGILTQVDHFRPKKHFFSLIITFPENALKMLA